MNQTLGFDVRMPVFSHETFGNSVDLQSKKILSRLSHTPWAATYLKSGALSGVAIEQCASTHIRSLADLDRLLKSILYTYEEADQADGAVPVMEDRDVCASAAAAAAGGAGVSPPGEESAEVGSVFSGCTGTRRSSGLHRPSGHSEADAAAVRGRRGLPWAVRAAFFEPVTVPDTLTSTATTPARFYTQTAGASLEELALEEATLQDEIDLEEDDAIDVMVSPMSSARLSRASPRTRVPTRTPSATTAGGAATAPTNSGDGHGGSSPTSTVAPESQAEASETGRLTMPYRPFESPVTRMPGEMPEAAYSCSSSTCSSATAQPGGSPVYSESTRNAEDEDTSPMARPRDKTRKNAHIALPDDEGTDEGRRFPYHSHQQHHHHHDARTAPGSPFRTTASQPAASAAAAAAASSQTMTPEELAGWLHLTVWTRCEIVSLLRELSGVQGYIAWSAWYWSYALANPRFAMVHQALGSVSFWKRLFVDGFSSRLANVHLLANQHMFQLKSAFQLLVSSIGALHGLLERLNGRLEEIQRQSERRSSAVATVAAASCGRCVTATQSFYSLEELPYSASSAGASMGSPLLRRPLSRSMPLPHSQALSRAALSGRSTNHADSDGEPEGRGHATAVHTISNQSYANNQSYAGEAYGGSGSLLGGAAAAISGAMEDAVLPDYVMLEELRVAVLSTISNVLAVIRPQSVSSALARSNAAFTETTTLEQLTAAVGGGCTSELSSIASGDGSPPLRRPPGAAAVRMATGSSTRTPPPQSAFARATSSYAFDRNGGAEGGEDLFYFATTSVPRRFGEYQVARTLSLREGVAALLYCVQSSQMLLRELLQLVVVENKPPSTRHWARVLTAVAVVAPSFYWLYTKSPEQIAAVARTVGATLKTLFTSYVAMPFAQIRDAIFYVRPGVEDRRRTLDRDAEALANIIRDYHENYYPALSQVRLDEVRDHTFQCFRDGVADEEGYGLIEQHYRNAVKHPIRSAFFGDLPRILLIQLSYQQLEVTRVVNGMDEVLEGNDLNFKIMAIMPVVGLVGIGALWTLWRWRAQYKPMQMRMKQYWRAVSRVVTFADGEGVSMNVVNPIAGGSAGYELQPYSPMTYADGYGAAPPGAPGSMMDSPRFPNVPGRRHVHNDWQPANPSLQERAMVHESEEWARRLPAEAAPNNQGIESWAAADARPSVGVSRAERDTSLRRPQIVTPMNMLFSGKDRDVDTEDAPRTPAVPPTPYPVAVPLGSVTALNNYEQGTVLLLTHLMRSTAIWYLGRYPYYYELMSDLEDLESAQCSRHQRLRTLQRMIVTHDFLK